MIRHGKLLTLQLSDVLLLEQLIAETELEAGYGVGGFDTGGFGL